jgi:hypothetical protein
VADPPLTTYAVDTRAAGRALAEMLISIASGAAPEELRRIVPARLIPRESDRRFTVIPTEPPGAAPGSHPRHLPDRKPMGG